MQSFSRSHQTLNTNISREDIQSSEDDQQNKQLKEINSLDSKKWSNGK